MRRGILLLIAAGLVVVAVLGVRRSLTSAGATPLPTADQAPRPAAPATKAKPGANRSLSTSPQADTGTREEWLAALRRRIAAGATAEEILADLKFLLQRQPTLAIDLALTVARSEEEKYLLVSRLVAEWATFNPDAAWAKALELGRAHTVPGDPELPSVVLAQLASTDPDRVVILADNALQTASGEDTSAFAGGDIAQLALRALVTAKQTDLARRTLERWAGTAAAEALGNAPFEEVALDYARRSRTEAAEWLSSLPASSGRDFTLATLAADWATAAPQEAMTWATSLESTSGRSEAMQRAFNRWAETDIVAAAQWVAEHESNPQADTLIANLVADTSLSHVAPERAVQWAELIRDPAARQTTVQRVISAWGEHDATAAIRFAEQTPLLDAAARQQMLEQLRRAPKPQE